MFKKKEKKEVIIKANDSLGDIAVKLAKDDVISVPKDDNHNTYGELLDHLVDGELPWGWVHVKRNFIEPRDKKLYDLHIRSCKATSIIEEKKLTEEFLNFFYSYKKECEELGECYVQYFSEMFEQCHNSKELCFSMGVKKEERLAFINEHYNELVLNEQTKNELLSTLSEDIERLIIEKPGIIQSELIKKFDPIVKGDISTLLYEWEKQNKIQREKKGRSYSLTMN